MVGLDTLPIDAVEHALSFADAATLVRCALASRVLRDAAVRVAGLRAVSLGLDVLEDADVDDYGDDDGCEEGERSRPWERATRRPLAAVFEAELARLVRRARAHAGACWLDSAAFACFRLTERELDYALDVRETGVASPPPLLLVTARGDAEWLHDVSTDEYDFCLLYEACALSRGCPDDWDGDLGKFGLRTHERLYTPVSNDYLAFTTHMPLHPAYGRPQHGFDALLSAAEGGGAEPLSAWRLDPLRAWLRATEGRGGSERARFDADVGRAGLDAAVVLSRFAHDSLLHGHRRLQYGGQQQRLDEHDVRCTLALATPPWWQRRPDPFDCQTQRRFFEQHFEHGPPLYDPLHDRVIPTRLHSAIGDRDGPWLVATLSLYDALQRLP